MPLTRWRIREPAAAIGALAVLPALLGGCAAAVVAPVLAAGTMVASGEKNNRRAQERAAAEEPTPDASAPRLTLVDPAAFIPRSAQSAEGLLMTEEGWPSFVDFAIERNRVLAEAGQVSSALLAPGSIVREPERLPCRSPSAAVIVDLDRGDTIFSPTADVLPAPGLAESLARLREAGIAVLWVSGADANKVTEIGNALRNSGLDPTGKDPLLLVRSPEERKQVMRTEANQFSCVVAIAGDRRNDFDELFDYLRNPDFAFELDALLGDGWFIVPPPLDIAPAPVAAN